MALAGSLPDIVLEWVWSLAPLPRCRPFGTADSHQQLEVLKARDR